MIGRRARRKPALRHGVYGALVLATVTASPALAHTATPADAAQLQASLASNRTTAQAITAAALTRIAAMDRKGPTLRAMIALNPDAMAQARAADARRRAGHVLGPLDGMPVLIKDNIETRDPMATTAGSLALAANISHRDAPVVARLRAAGAVILGKTNLSEWANIRSHNGISGWSAIGGIVRNPYALDRTACGSSSGSAAGVAAGYAPLAAVTTRTLAAVIAFNDAHAAAEMPYFGQDYFIEAQQTDGLNTPAYLSARAKATRLAGAEGIDAMLDQAQATILIAPTYGPAWLTDPIYGDQYDGPAASGLPAIAGYPHLTVPMGLVRGLPVGLSFITRPFGEAALLQAGYVYEQAAHARTAPRYLPHADIGTGMDGAGRP